MSLHQTSFCFVCSHLTSGQKEGDELRRNSDVMEILRKTRFPRVHGLADERSPETILEHDRVIWLGDLNYRVALSYRSAKALVEMRNWKALLEKDQIHGVVDLGGCGDDINNGDPSQSQGVNRDTSSQLNDQQSVPASEAHGEEHGHKHEPTVLVHLCRDCSYGREIKAINRGQGAIAGAYSLM